MKILKINTTSPLVPLGGKKLLVGKGELKASSGHGSQWLLARSGLLHMSAFVTSGALNMALVFQV
jgi:hypothetical protein